MILLQSIYCNIKLIESNIIAISYWNNNAIFLPNNNIAIFLPNNNIAILLPITIILFQTPATSRSDHRSEIRHAASYWCYHISITTSIRLRQVLIVEERRHDTSVHVIIRHVSLSLKVIREPDRWRETSWSNHHWKDVIIIKYKNLAEALSSFI